MGEVILAAILVIVLVALGTSAAYYAIAVGRQRPTLEHVPAPAIGSDDRPLASKLQQYYRLSQRAVRALEDILRRDEVLPYLEPEARKRIEQIVSEFYDI